MSKSDKNHNHSHQDQSKKNIKIAFCQRQVELNS